MMYSNRGPLDQAFDSSQTSICAFVSHGRGFPIRPNIPPGVHANRALSGGFRLHLSKLELLAELHSSPRKGRSTVQCLLREMCGMFVKTV